MTRISRRDALARLAAIPLAAAFAFDRGALGRAAGLTRALGDADSIAPYVPTFFTAREWATVRVLVDYVIPRDDRSGSATDARVPEFMDFILADDEASRSSRVAMRGGLAWIDAECRERFGHRFVACTDAQRRTVLDDIAWPAKVKPALSQGAAFFTHFRDFTASGFFSTDIGWRDLRYEGNGVYPSWEGCPPAALRKLGVSYDDAGDGR